VRERIYACVRIYAYIHVKRTRARARARLHSRVLTNTHSCEKRALRPPRRKEREEGGGCAPLHGVGVVVRS